MATTAILERRGISVVSVDSEDSILVEARKELFQEAERVLGYRPQSGIQAAEIGWRTTNTVAVAFGDDIKPFTTKSVDTYKRRITKWNWLAHTISGLPDDDGNRLMKLLVMLGSLSFIVSLFGFVMIWSGDASRISRGWRVAGISGLSMSACIVLLFGMLVLADKVKVLSWHLVDLNGFQDEVPDFVLQTAITIKKRLPEATFFVDVCQKEKLNVDPFLVMQFRGESYYLEVWNEPKFEKGSST